MNTTDIKHLYAVETADELLKYQDFVRHIQPKLDKYLRFLKENYEVQELPNAVVWTSKDIATRLISDIPVPAYTNDFRIVITPDLDAWRGIYLKQLDCHEESDTVKKLREYYHSSLSENNILQILGHELVHHSELFLEDFNSEADNGIWFEEGMAEYISRRYFLTDEEFKSEAAANQQLVDLYKAQYGNHSLDEFGTATYTSGYAGIFFEYWRSFLAIQKIVEDHNGDVPAVFRSYHEWNESKNRCTLSDWFHVNI